MSREEELLRRLRAAFQIEASESLAALDAGLLDLEKAAPSGALPPDVVERIYREAHNLKGAGRAVNMPAVEALCQPLESVFALWKKGAAPPHTISAAAFDTLHAAVDAIGKIVEAETAGNAPPDIVPLAKQIAALAEGRRSEVGGGRSEVGGGRSEVASADNPPAPRSVSAPQADVPQPATGTPATGTPATGTPATTQPPNNPTTQSETVRIATEKLDALLLQAEEMLAAKMAARRQSSEAQALLTQLAYWENEWAKVLPALRALAATQSAAQNSQNSLGLLDFLEWNRAQIKQLQGAASTLAVSAAQDGRTIGGLVDNLLADTKKLLLLPCSTLLDGFPRAVRDLARERGKDVELLLSGGDVEVDKRILEEMKAPLVHLLRNAVDHGIEEGTVRQSLGKNAQAKIEVRVTQRGGEIEFLVRDDGGGILVARVKDRAVERGLLTAEEAFRLNDEAAAQLIFASELSTSDTVDEVSGRGLGMAIVREKVERLGGRIAIETHLGHGTTFLITLPQTLATFRGLLVQAAGQTFVLPSVDVAHVMRLRPEDVHSIAGRPTMRLDNRTIRLLPLAEALGLPAANAPAPRWLTVIILGSERNAAVTVDAVLDEQEVLVKQLNWPLRRVRGVSGATVLADGRATPILNVPDLQKIAAHGTTMPVKTAAPRAEKNAPRTAKSVLVVDDSITSRMLLKDILEASGYRVKTAVDGLDALTALRSENFDLLVSDVDMPRLDGFDLVTRLRADANFKDLPAILVTGRDSREDRERGFDAGASAYVVKSNFDQSNLLEIVRRFI